MLVLVNLPVEHQHKGGQYQNHGSHAQHHAFGHHDTNVPSQSQPHEAERQKACNRGQTGAGEGPERRDYGLSHGVPLVIEVGPFFLVAVV